MPIGFSYRATFPKKLCRFYFLALQEFLQRKFERNECFWIGRMSGIESAYVGAYVYENEPFERFDFTQMRLHSGIHVLTEVDWKEYVDKTIVAMVDASLLAIWDGDCYLQCEALYKYMENHYPFIHTIPAHALEPYLYMYQDDAHDTIEPKYRFAEVWRHKRVLIITSHGDSVAYQIQHNLEKVFAPFHIFHSTTQIMVYKCTQQNGINGDGYGWKGHFLKMCYDISQFEFDVALIGCGGFSNLLGHYIYKEMKRSAIYLGGPIQLYFGIMGRRWLAHPHMKAFLNQNGDHWIRPLSSDQPIEKDAIDGACYWM